MDCKALKVYLKDLYRLESQLYICEKIREDFQRPIDAYTKYSNFSEDDIKTGDVNYGYARAILELQGCVYDEYNRIVSDPVQRRGYTSTSDYIKSVQGDITRNYLKEQEMARRKTYTTVTALALDNLEREYFAKKGKPIIIVCSLLALISLFFFDGVFSGIGVIGFAFLGAMLIAATAPGGKGSMDVSIEVERIKKMLYDDMIDILRNNFMIAQDNAQVRYKYASKIMDQELLPKCKQIRELLKELYAQDIIQTKFRNLVMISQIYEYIDTSVCTELEGLNGAYNVLEREVRQEHVVLELDAIKAQQNKLSRNMLYMLGVLSQAEKAMDCAAAALQRSGDNVAFTEYLSSVTEVNTEIKNRYQEEKENK